MSGPHGRAQILVPSRDIQINLGPSSLGPPSINEFPVPPASDIPFKPNVRQLPTTRLSQLLGVKEAFAAAKSGDEDGIPYFALAAAIERGERLRIHANDSSDVGRAIQLAKELGHPAVLVGLANAARHAESLAQVGFPVVIEVGLDLTTDQGEFELPDPETAAVLKKHGVRVALSTTIQGSADEAFLCGAIALRGGLSRIDAVDAMTRVPAEILGVEERVGSLVVGKDADFFGALGRALCPFFPRPAGFCRRTGKGLSQKRARLRARGRDRHPRRYHPDRFRRGDSRWRRSPQGWKESPPWAATFRFLRGLAYSTPEPTRW